MLTLSIIIIILSGIILFLGNYAFNIKNKLRKKEIIINKISDKVFSDIRHGYYDNTTLSFKGSNGNYVFRLYVTEIEQYINNESKIKLDRIELLTSPNGEAQTERATRSARNLIKEYFCSIIKTSDVTWLVSKDLIKEQRRKKLKQIIENGK